jgi:hypothetical protein
MHRDRTRIDEATAFGARDAPGVVPALGGRGAVRTQSDDVGRLSGRLQIAAAPDTGMPGLH